MARALRSLGKGPRGEGLAVQQARDGCGIQGPLAAHRAQAHGEDGDEGPGVYEAPAAGGGEGEGRLGQGRLSFERGLFP